MEPNALIPPPRGESVPGLGVVAWDNPGDRVTYATGVLALHTPHGSKLTAVLLWPLLTSRTVCTHCGGPWPCNRATWAHEALHTQDGTR
ncbi:hypothetical protein [Micromonospora sp. NPDC005652]|uniref:hypothetical protein n=1 Tax=Micromonospora sp. NPDC005652 TaxID=3157046 RepID=UPI0033F2019C